MTSSSLETRPGNSGSTTAVSETTGPTITCGDRALIEHHLVDAIPTVPGAVLIEFAVRHALGSYPGYSVVAVSQVRFDRYLRCRTDGQLPVLSITATPLDTLLSGDAVDLGVTLAIATRVRPLRCAAMTVHLTRRPIPAQRCENTPDFDGTNSVDPYTQPGSPVALSGPFEALTRPRRSRHGGSARFRIPPHASTPGLAAYRTAVLLLDCLIRTRAQTIEPHADADLLALAVPTGIGRIDLCTPYNDIEMTLRYDHIALRHHPGSNTSTASSDGHTLMRLHGLTTQTLAWYRPSSHEWSADGANTSGQQQNTVLR